MNGDVPFLSLGPGAEGVSYASVLHGVSFYLKQKAEQGVTLDKTLRRAWMDPETL
jgi:hypothetical protein